MMRNALEISNPAMVHIAKITSSITRPLVFLLVRLLSPERLASPHTGGCPVSLGSLSRERVPVERPMAARRGLGGTVGSPGWRSCYLGDSRDCCATWERALGGGSCGVAYLFSYWEDYLPLLPGWLPVVA